MPSRFDALWVDPLNDSSFNAYHAYERKHSLVSKRDKAICDNGTTIVITIVTGKIWYVTNVIVRNKGLLKNHIRFKIFYNNNNYFCA